MSYPPPPSSTLTTASTLSVERPPKEQGCNGWIKTPKIIHNLRERAATLTHRVKKYRRPFTILQKGYKLVRKEVKSNLWWIPANLSVAKLKPVLRCAVVAWICLVIFVIPTAQEDGLGGSAYLILIAAFISPCSDPFMATLEREMLILTFVCLAWAWSNLGIFFASLARRVHDSSITIQEASSGQYIEAAPTVVLAIFVFTGNAFFLYVKARQGVGPYFFACVFGCICLDIALTTAALLPSATAAYHLGRAIAVPFAVHSAAALLGSALVFPHAVSSRYTLRMCDLVSALTNVIEGQPAALRIGSKCKSKAGSDDAEATYAATERAEAALAPLAAAGRLLPADLVYARFAPRDFVPLEAKLRRAVGRAEGLGMALRLGMGGMSELDGHVQTQPDEGGSSVDEDVSSDEGQGSGYGDGLETSRKGTSRNHDDGGSGASMQPGEKGKGAVQDGDSQETRGRQLAPVAHKSSRPQVVSTASTPAIRRTSQKRKRGGVPLRAHFTLPADVEHPMSSATAPSGHAHSHIHRSSPLRTHFTSSPTPGLSALSGSSSANMPERKPIHNMSSEKASIRTPNMPMRPILSRTSSRPPSTPHSRAGSRATSRARSHSRSRSRPPSPSPLSPKSTRSPTSSIASRSRSKSHSRSHSFISLVRTRSGGGGVYVHGRSLHALLAQTGGRHVKQELSHLHDMHDGHSGHARGHSHERHRKLDHGEDHGRTEGGRTSRGAALSPQSQRSAAGRDRRSLGMERKPNEWAVGMFESQRYMDLQRHRLHDPREEEWMGACFSVLEASCTPLLNLCTLGFRTTNEWLATTRTGRFGYMFNIKQDSARAALKARREHLRDVLQQVKKGLQHFRDVDRHIVLEPYSKAFYLPSSRNSTWESISMSRNNSLTRSAARAALSSPGSPNSSLPRPTSPPVSGPRLSASRLCPPTTDEMLHVLDTDYINQRLDTAKGESFNISDAHLEHDAPSIRVDGPEVPNLGVASDTNPPHRYLFRCYVYQYNLIQIANIVIELLEEIIELEDKRRYPRLWTPVGRVFRWNPWSVPEDVEHLQGDDNPDIIQGLPADIGKAHQADNRAPSQAPFEPYHDDPDYFGATGTPRPSFDTDHDLGLPHGRNPDALPPRNLFEYVAGLIYALIIGLSHGNAVFALKVGLLTVILCLPYYISNSAKFAYDNRYVWAIFMGQLTLARFRGETTFSLVARISATFFGGLTGMTMWYISTGNPYGLAAVCVVCFPILFFATLYCPVHYTTNTVFFITASLVIGFSYQDYVFDPPNSQGVGFSVFWRRFVLVTIGVVAAFLFSFLPPSTTIRKYQRNLLSTTSAELGAIYCSIISFANTYEGRDQEVYNIVASLIAVRSKLSRSKALWRNIGYEISFRGRWPSQRYKRIANLQMSLAYSLSHLSSVLEHLNPSWSQAFLRCTRFLDPDFQGDLLGVISVISLSLRTGTPIPQITPCPLLDRFTLTYHGLDIIHKDSEEDYGLPRTLSLETLRDEQYLMFSVGISIAYEIVNTLDKLMLAVKEVVGEQYHIHGIGMTSSRQPSHTV